MIDAGAELAPDALPGFGEAAHNVYALDGAVAAGRALRAFQGGRVVVLVWRLPYKCPAAPYETAPLAEAVLRRRGVRARATVDNYAPEPLPMPTAGPQLGEALRATLEGKGIGFHPQRTVDAIDAGAGELQLADGERVGYDLLLGVPPHRAPAVVRESGLASESGFLPVDRATLAVVNLATGLEDAERVTVAFLVAGAALDRGKQVVMFLTKEAVRLGLKGVARGTACEGCPSLETLFEQYADRGGELLVCPICFNTKQLSEGDLVAHARLAGATPLWEWIGEGATVFSY